MLRLPPFSARQTAGLPVRSSSSLNPPFAFCARPSYQRRSDDDPDPPRLIALERQHHVVLVNQDTIEQLRPSTKSIDDRNGVRDAEVLVGYDLDEAGGSWKRNLGSDEVEPKRGDAADYTGANRRGRPDG